MKRAFALLEALVLLAAVVLLSTVLIAVFRPRNEHYPSAGSSCRSNLKNLSLGFQQYVQDYDERLPLVRLGTTNKGWGYGLFPYVKSSSIYRCPSGPRWRSDSAAVQSHNSDYFMNRRLSGLEMRTVVISSRTVVLGEGDGDMDAAAPHSSLTSIPPEWPGDPGSPRNRHLEGCNFGFVDGHVKWIPAKVTVGTANPKWVQYTFAPR